MSEPTDFGDRASNWREFRQRIVAKRSEEMTDKERFFDDCLLDSAEDDIMGYRPHSVLDALTECWARYGDAEKAK